MVVRGRSWICMLYLVKLCVQTDIVIQMLQWEILMEHYNPAYNNYGMSSSAIIGFRIKFRNS